MGQSAVDVVGGRRIDVGELCIVNGGEGAGGEPAADAQEGDRAGGGARDAKPASGGRYAEPDDPRDVEPRAILCGPSSVRLLQVDGVGDVLREPVALRVGANEELWIIR